MANKTTTLETLRSHRDHSMRRMTQLNTALACIAPESSDYEYAEHMADLSWEEFEIAQQVVTDVERGARNADNRRRFAHIGLA